MGFEAGGEMPRHKKNGEAGEIHLACADRYQGLGAVVDLVSRQ